MTNLPTVTELRAVVDSIVEDGFITLNNAELELFEDVVTALNYVSYNFIEANMITKDDGVLVIDLLPEQEISIELKGVPMLLVHDVILTTCDVYHSLPEGDTLEQQKTQAIENLLELCTQIKTTYQSTIDAAIRQKFSK